LSFYIVAVAQDEVIESREPNQPQHQPEIGQEQEQHSQDDFHAHVDDRYEGWDMDGMFSVCVFKINLL